jgi:NAD(P)-dependent dehydrogenase (short-subunit alcohol dehydrogenase family)
VQADAVQTADWEKVLSQAVAAFGRVDVLVNNHGAGVKIAPVAEQDDAAIEAALAINLTSVIKGCRVAVKIMQPQGRGQIINVSSACAYHSWGNWGVYTAAKAGMVAFTRCLAVEMAQWGGRATSFIPGAARTNFCQASGLDNSWQEGYPSAEEFVRALVHCIDQPENTVIEELNVWGVRQIKDMMNPF